MSLAMDSSDLARAGTLPRDPGERARVVSADPAPKGNHKTISERALGLASKGKRLATGYRTLDAAMRGGILPGVIVLGGKPGAAKTTWLCCLARGFAERGIVVSILGADEEADGLLIRVGQALGFSREELEEADSAETLQNFADTLQSAVPSLDLIDALDEDVTIEMAASDLLARAGGRPAVLMVDSMQTVKSDAADGADTAKARVDANVMALKRAARSGLYVFVTCELNRASYRSKNPDERIDDLAAFKESGGVEYGAHVALVMHPVSGAEGTVDVRLAKNRWGQKTPMRLKLNFETATLEEVEMPPEALVFERDPANELESDIAAVLKVLKENPGIAGNENLCRQLRGMGKTRARRGIKALEDNGTIENRGTAKRPRLFLAEAPHLPESPESPHLPGVSGDSHSPHSPHPYRGASSGASSRETE